MLIMKKLIITCLAITAFSSIIECSSDSKKGTIIIQTGFPDSAKLYGKTDKGMPIYVLQLFCMYYQPDRGVIIVKNVLPEQKEQVINVQTDENGGIGYQDCIKLFEMTVVHYAHGDKYKPEQEKKLDSGETISASEFYYILKKRNS